jgi:hypothetical protein
VIDFNRDFAELAKKERGRCDLGSRLDEWARRQDAYLIQSRFSPLEIIGRGPSRLTCTVSGVHLGETDQKTGIGIR